eukprot:CAMPEP_0118659606 /NCGR_PEP_ID=MMETSP0785-20121206/15207_1 /TAXON_ID=91992 /ORGANISM="Bolidomonas pacifica, Strain CCMP 1866" /LENGTH=125 /DNA_ID=CAMNT_0006552733 /DNA_START=35 /DNA_END=408 /DNA_ORIENTATION=+
MPMIDTDLDGAVDRARILRWYKKSGDVIEEGDTICDVEIDFDADAVFDEAFEGTSIEGSESIVLGLDCEDEGVMGEQYLRSFEDGCTKEEYEEWLKAGNAICDVLVYEEENWREKYGNVNVEGVG